jgi:glycosyltransferase involved in cell wall biosynthesis
MNTPRVLYVMPVYNAERWLEESVLSVLNQDYAAFRLLCVDDGSTDASPDILRGVADRDERVVVLAQANAGPGAAFNRGLAYALRHDYPYVARMDADDLSLPARTRQQVELMERHPETAACSGQATYFTVDRDPCGASRIPVLPDDVRREILKGGRGLIQGATLFRTSALQAVGGYRAEKTPAEDTDIFLRLSEMFPLRSVPDVLYRIRICADSHSLQNIYQTRLYHHYFLHLASLRSRGFSEVSVEDFRNTMTLYRAASIRREAAAVAAYFSWMIERSIPALLSASLLDPKRTLRRMVRKWWR